MFFCLPSSSFVLAVYLGCVPTDVLALCLVTLLAALLHHGPSVSVDKALIIYGFTLWQCFYGSGRTTLTVQIILVMGFSVWVLLMLLHASSIFSSPTRRQAAQAPLSPAVISTAGGGLPNAPPPPTLSNYTLNGFQIAEFLENMESAFFQAGVKNLTQWGTQGYPVNTLDVVSRVAAVSSQPILG